MFRRKLAIQSINRVIERPPDLYAVFAAVTCGRELEIQYLMLHSASCDRFLILGGFFRVSCSVNNAWESLDMGLYQEGFLNKSSIKNWRVLCTGGQLSPSFWLEWGRGAAGAGTQAPASQGCCCSRSGKQREHRDP